MKLIAILLGLFLIATAAEARPRVYVYGSPTWVPGTGLYWMSKHTCTFVAWSVDPATPAGHYTLGKCPPRNVVWPL